LEHASYILPDMMTYLPPQAIKCRLEFGAPLDDDTRSGECWPSQARKEFIRLVSDKRFKIRFIRRELLTDYTTDVGQHLKI